MIQELKRTPITFNGVDGWEVLIKDDEIGCDGHTACDRCMYRLWIDTHLYIAILATCVDVHDCLPNYQTYFEFQRQNQLNDDAI